MIKCAVISCDHHALYTCGQGEGGAGSAGGAGFRECRAGGEGIRESEISATVDLLITQVKRMLG